MTPLMPHGPDSLPPPLKPPSRREYVVGIPLCITVHDDGRVTLDVDLSEASDFESDEYDEATWIADTHTVGRAVEQIRHTHRIHLNGAEQ